MTFNNLSKQYYQTQESTRIYPKHVRMNEETERSIQLDFGKHLFVNDDFLWEFMQVRKGSFMCMIVETDETLPTGEMIMW